MNNSEKAINQLIEHLKELNYPLELIFREFKISNLRTDIAIIEPSENDVIALIETKTGLKHPESHVQRYAQKYSLVGLKTIPLFLVFFTNQQRQVYFIQDGNYQHIDDFPPYNDLRLKVLSEIKVNKSLAKKKTLDLFSIISWALAGSALLVLVLDAYSIYKLNIERLSLIVAIIFLVLLPFASKLKILGFEFEEKMKNKIEAKV